DLLLVRYPPVLQFPPAGRSKWKVRHLWIVANQSPYELDGSDCRYDVGDCTNHATYIFGIEPLWVPQGPTVRRVISPCLDSALLADFDNPSIVTADSQFGRDAPDPASPIRVGRYSRDHPLKFPPTRE